MNSTVIKSNHKHLYEAIIGKVNMGTHTAFRLLHRCSVCGKIRPYKWFIVDKQNKILLMENEIKNEYPDLKEYEYNYEKVDGHKMYIEL